MNDKTLKISDAKIKTMLEEISKYVRATNVVEMAQQIAWLLFESD